MNIASLGDPKRAQHREVFGAFTVGTESMHSSIPLWIFEPLYDSEIYFLARVGKMISHARGC